ncbi:MAG: GspE/PulE family protein [Helicobacter sp.]|nr:GspE/PulE family protein [Helicobacter sp.]
MIFDNLKLDLNITNLLNIEQMEHFCAIILQKQEKLKIALVNESKNPHKTTLSTIFKNEVLEFIDIKQEQFLKIITILKEKYFIQDTIEKIKFELKEKDTDDKDSSVAELLNFILQKAVLKNASDVHFELDIKKLRIRFRIDGVLIEFYRFNSWLFAPLSSFIKLLAHLNLTESKLPQDGRFSLELTSVNNNLNIFDFRVSTLPLIEGESIVLRILDKQKTLLPLESLGFFKEDLVQMQKLFNLPYGLVFLTGPTGSGKSTTMYAILNILKERNLKIITLEEPVEYRVQHINQVQINAQVDFNKILRNVLRQDPDVIILGEVRDNDSLKLAIQAAFTGHLVFATLHTNNALDSISRLLDMGLEAHFITEALSGVIAQRLVRKLCSCSEKKENDFISKGCESCNFTGYKGRIAIAEILALDSNLQDYIKGKITKTKMLEILNQNTKNYSLKDKANLLEKLGITDKKEIARVIL